MLTDQDWAPAVKKLVALTESGELTWERFLVFPPRTEEVQGHAFHAVVQRRDIAVYEYRFRHYEDEGEWYWANDVAIEFVSPGGELQWRWPATPHRWALIEAIRAQLTQAPDFLREFLAEGKPG